MTQTTLKLYRDLLRTAKKWPNQPQRALNVQQLIINEIKRQFRSKEGSIEYANTQLLSMRSLIDNELQKQYGPLKDSKIIQNLPDRSRFVLLDRDGQLMANKVSGFQIMWHRLKKWFNK